LYLPLNLTYNISIDAYDEGNCTMTSCTPLTDTVAVCAQTIFNITQNTTAKFSMQQGSGEYVLYVDENGDRITDYELTPEKQLFQAIETITHEINFNGEKFYVITESNSTITNLIFNQSTRSIAFGVEGINQTTGFCNITIPSRLLDGPYTVKIDGLTISENFSAPSNGTHVFLCFCYDQSSHTMEIIGTKVIPEFQLLLILPIFGILTLLFIIIRKKKRIRIK